MCLATDNLPENLLSAIVYVPEAVNLSIPHMDKMIKAETKEVNKMRKTGKKSITTN